MTNIEVGKLADLPCHDAAKKERSADRMAIRVSLINMKGGVGKSTLTVNLAWHFASYGQWHKKVLVVDLDPQFNASQYLLGVQEYEKILRANKPTIWDVFEQGTRTPSGKTALPNAHAPVHSHHKFYGGGVIDLIPSRLELAFSLKNPAHKERHLAKLIDDLDADYDLILIDCAPTESVLTTAAYLASEWLLVPVKPEYLSTIGLPLLVNSMQDFKAEYDNKKLELAGVVFNAADDYLPEEALAKNTVRQIAKKNGWNVFEHEVEYSRSYPKGAREGKPIFGTSYSRWSKVQNFQAVAEEFAKKVGL
jgi:chromosome partitioning protein